MDEPKKARVERGGNQVSVICPHCGMHTLLPGFQSVEVFVCPRCQEPSEVEEAPN